ncbi:S41 family peptidase [Oceanirhabdus seepicola]|uniref:Peptidase S41 n=1 Tax=Oceanirhabdus seepicola TaxID=2828781 RepID=A0A9J6P1L0_9CLOT|nr:S41 family peptidase [Oceanirhabdus seepicola]MCM1989384.1 peptidase S41 [Oceanirhabdus seepicola]
MLKIFKKVTLVLLIFSFIGAIFAGCSNKYISKSGDRVEMWEKDIDYLAKELPKRHKNLFFKLTEEEFNTEIDKLKESLEQLNDDKIRLNIQKIVASAGDGHTTTNIGADKMFPMELYWFNDGFYVINTSPEYEKIMYSKLIEVNSQDINSVIEKLSKVISHDNIAHLRSKMPIYIEISTIMCGLDIIDNPDYAKFTFENRNGQEIELEMKSTGGEYVLDNILGKGKVGEIPLYMKNSDKFYWYEYFEDDKMIYFKYNLCRQMKEKSFKKFSKELMEAINNKDVEKLVIDIRNNGGGSSPILNNFIDELSNCKLNQKGKLYVIVGKKTFSSAILNAISLKQKTEAIFIGEPTGGKPNHYGEVKSFKLPNNKVRVKYSTKYFTNYDEDIDSFIPDKIIELTIDDYINNNDPILDYIRKQAQE